jgi:HPt (histidine-containing phosphotransfer) domain-containing protein
MTDAPVVLLLQLDDALARNIEIECHSKGVELVRTWPVQAIPVLCIASPHAGPTLFEVRQLFPDCLLAIFGEPTSHAYPNEAIWLRHTETVAAVASLLDMVCSPNPLDEQDLQEIRTIFWNRYDEDLRMYPSWLQAGAFEQLQRIGHQLAGSAATLGYPRLGLVGQKLEEAASHANLPMLLEAYKALRDFDRL